MLNGATYVQDNLNNEITQNCQKFELYSKLKL